MNPREYGHLAKEVQRVSPALRIKVLSLGEPGYTYLYSRVGKSCLIKRYCESRFIADYISTIGIDYGVKSAHIDGIDLKINFWDVAGDPQFYEVRNEFYKDTLGAILVYDTTAGKTFDVLDKWVEELRKLGGNDVVIVLVGNKTDLSPRIITEEDGRVYAEKKGFAFYETSALTSKNVKEMFDSLFRAVIEKKRQKK